ncbi:MAG: hypothetical protein RLY40_320 [Pseudomonadota bacterium]|jgi:hypothetical protein
MPIYPFSPKDETLNIAKLCPEGREYIQKLLNFPKEDNFSEFPNNPILNWEELLFRPNENGEKEICEGEDKQKRKTEILEKLKELEDSHQFTIETKQVVLRLMGDELQQTQDKAKSLLNTTLAVFFTTVFLVIAAVLVVVFFPPATALILPLFTNLMTSIGIGTGLLLTFLPSLALGLTSLFKFQKRNELQAQSDQINDELARLDPDNSIRDSLNNPAFSLPHTHNRKIVHGHILPSETTRLVRSQSQLSPKTTTSDVKLEQEDTEKDNYNSLPTNSSTPNVFKN